MSREMNSLSAGELRELSYEDLLGYTARLREEAQRDKERFDQSERSYALCVTELDRRVQERRQAEALAEAERFVVLQWIYPEDAEAGEDWGDYDASIHPLSRVTPVMVGLFRIVLEERCMRLVVGEEVHKGHVLPEIRYPAEAREILFCTEGKDQKLYRATFFDSLEDAQAFLDQYKTPKEG